MNNLGQRENRTSKEVIFFSGEALKLIEEADNCSIRHYASATGLEAWFSVPDFKAVVVSPRCKMAIVIFIRAYIISSLSHSFLNSFLALWPLLANTVIYSGILVVSLTYLMMPVFNKLLRRWLYPAKRYSQ